MLIHLAVLALRGLQLFHLNDITISLAVDKVRQTVRLLSSSSPSPSEAVVVKYFETPLRCDARIWASFCQLRRVAPGTEMPPMFVRSFIVVDSRPSSQQQQAAQHRLMSTLPMSETSPFAFAIDAPFMLDIHRQHLLDDPSRGKVSNRQ